MCCPCRRSGGPVRRTAGDAAGPSRGSLRATAGSALHRASSSQPSCGRTAGTRCTRLPRRTGCSDRFRAVCSACSVAAPLLQWLYRHFRRAPRLTPPGSSKWHGFYNGILFQVPGSRKGRSRGGRKVNGSGGSADVSGSRHAGALGTPDRIVRVDPARSLHLMKRTASDCRSWRRHVRGGDRRGNRLMFIT